MRRRLSQTFCSRDEDDGPAKSDERRPAPVQRAAEQDVQWQSVLQGTGLPPRVTLAARTVHRDRGTGVQHQRFALVRPNSFGVAVRARQPGGRHAARIHLEERGQVGRQANDSESVASFYRSFG